MFTSFSLQSHCKKKKFQVQREREREKKNSCNTTRCGGKKIHVSLLPELGLACWWHSLYVLQGKIDVNEVII